MDCDVPEDIAIVSLTRELSAAPELSADRDRVLQGLENVLDNVVVHELPHKDVESLELLRKRLIGGQRIEATKCHVDAEQFIRVFGPSSLQGTGPGFKVDPGVGSKDIVKRDLENRFVAHQLGASSLRNRLKAGG